MSNVAMFLIGVFTGACGLFIALAILGASKESDAE